jgi:signal transduction histidine kinase
MRRLLQKSFSSVRGFWMSLMFLILLGAFAASLFLRLQQSQNRVIQYFSVWEEDLGRSLLLEKNTDLLLKISHQLQDLDSTVATSYATLRSGPQPRTLGEKPRSCSFETLVPISLSTLPAGHVSVCFSRQKLLTTAAASPLFLLCLLLTSLLILLSVLRENKKELALRHARDIADLSRQVAHDIRGPLMALKTLASPSYKNTEAKDPLLQGAIDRIHGIAEDLLKKSKSSPPPPPEKKKKVLGFCFLQNAIEEILPELRLRTDPILLNYVSYEKNPLMLGMDKSQLQRIISNLVQNSVDALQGRTEPTVSLLVHRKSGFALLEIIDNGNGIPENLLGAVLEGKSHGKSNGNGLGLSSSRRILEDLGGRLELHSKADTGTRVILKIPLSAESAEDSLFDYKS